MIYRLLVTTAAATALCLSLSIVPSAWAEPVPEPASPAPSDGVEAVRALLDAGRYAEAEAQARAVLSRVEAERGPESLAAAEIVHVLVRSLVRGGKAASPDARRLAERVISIREKALGADHPDLAPGLNALASVLQATGDRAGARPLYERALALREKALGPEHPDVAQSLNNLASLLKAMGDYAAARPLLERALAILEKAHGPEHLAVTSTLGNLAGLREAMGDHAGARPLYERSLAIREKALGAEHADVAASLNNLAGLLHATGDDAGARPLFERALAIWQAALGPDHHLVAVTLNNLALLASSMGDHASARSLYERALAILEEARGPEHPDVAWSLNNLASVLNSMGDHAGARPLYERSMTILQKALGPEHPDVALSVNNLADLLYTMGDYRAARPLFERSLAIREEALGPDHRAVAGSLNSLASLLQAMGDDVHSRPLFERAVAIWEKALGPDHPDVAHGLNNLALHLQAVGDYAAARPLFERALAIWETARGPDHPDVARGLGNLARLRQEMGDHVEARPLYERALAIHEKALGPNHRDVATGSNNLALLLQVMGDHAGARPLYERSLAIKEQTLGPEHPAVATSLDNLASLHCATGDPVLALEAALRAERIGTDHARLTFRVLSERQALRLAAVRASGLDVALSLAAAGLEPSERARAWDATVRSRALVLDEIGGRHRWASGSAGPAAAEIALTSAAQRLANLTVRGPGRESPDRYRKLLDDAASEKEQAERALSEQSVSFREEQARSGLGLADVTRALARGEALVAFARYERREVGRADAPARVGSKPVPSYLVFVMRGGEETPTAIAVGSAADVDTLVKAWRREAAQPAMQARSAGEELRRAVWDPLVPHLKDAQRVFVVPDGALHLVSFSALPAPASVEGADRYLVETGPLIHYLSAERDLVPSTASAPDGAGLFVVGGPAFDEPSLFAALAPPEPTRLEILVGHVAALVPFRGETARCAGFTSLHFGPLPASAREAADVAALWRTPRARPAQTAAVLHLSGAFASESAFKSGAAGKRVLHLATHGFFLGGDCESALQATRGLDLTEGVGGPPPPITGENPLLLSGLAFAGANRRAAAGPDEEDGILTAEEVASLDLSGVEWAVLSACDTALGDIKAGEGVFGLRRAFQVAGARTVVMSLWPVEDEATRQWMSALYDARLDRGLDTAECVREASLAVLNARRSQGLSTHPFHWGGFVAAGDWH